MLGTDELLQGRYKITRQLGQGGMGAVYEAEDGKQFGKIVALKEILTSLTNVSDAKQHELFRSAFEREAKILMQVDHEAFPQVIDYFSEESRQFLVMQLIQGKDLNELLVKRRGAFPIEEVCGWADQLLDALDYLHTLNPPIIHRDIKPQNLKLTERGKIKLLDFGIAKGVDKTSSVTITNATMVAATLHYSPSEQLLRVIDPITREALQMIYGEKMDRVLEQNADLRSDIYSLAATLYHFLTNNQPVDSLKRMIEFWRDKPDNLIAPNKLNPDIPKDISDWILKAMEIDREKRFSSALEMRNALHKAIAGKSRREEEVKQQSWAVEREKMRVEREKLAHERQKIEQERIEHQRQIEFERQRSAELEIQHSPDAATIVDLPTDHPAAPNFGLTQPSFASSTVPPNTEFSKNESHPATENSTENATAVSYFDGLNIGGEKTNENTPAQNETGFSYFQEAKVIPENNAAAPIPQNVRAEQTTNNIAATLNNNIKWLIPLAALAFLFMGGIAIGMWFLLGSSSGKSEAKDAPTNSSMINSGVKTSTTSESGVSPATDAGKINVGETSAQETNAAPTPEHVKTASEKKTAPPPKPETPTVQRTPPSVQAKTPAPVKKETSKPSPKKKDMNCILTDSCK